MSKPSAEQLKAMRETPAELIDLKIPMLAEGMSRDLLCKGENSTFRIHCYSTGMGEAHGLHAHVEEEHAFIVLHGRAIFSDIGGKLPAIGPNKGIWLPKGCFYEFINPGPEPLVVLRFGACHAGANESTRVTTEGEPIAGRSTMFAHLATPKPIEGAFFE